MTVLISTEGIMTYSLEHEHEQKCKDSQDNSADGAGAGARAAFGRHGMRVGSPGGRVGRAPQEPCREVPYPLYLLQTWARRPWMEEAAGSQVGAWQRPSGQGVTTVNFCQRALRQQLYETQSELDVQRSAKSTRLPRNPRTECCPPGGSPPLSVPDLPILRGSPDRAIQPYLYQARGPMQISKTRATQLLLKTEGSLLPQASFSSSLPPS